MAAVCVFCASSRTLAPGWLEVARETGVELARRGHALVSGGGRVGMMGVVAAAARGAGGQTIGVMPQQLVDLEIADPDVAEQVITPDLASRKIAMIAKSDAFLTLPGGLGTLDELFEVWTLATLGFHRKPIVLVDASGFYAGLVSWLNGLVEPGFVRAAGLDLLVVADSVPAGLDAVERLLDGVG
jgi:uncharacterized protein (TIGR00730 family)